MIRSLLSYSNGPKKAKLYSELPDDALRRGGDEMANYDPALDKVIGHYGEVEVNGQKYVIEGRKYGSYDPKLVVQNVWIDRRGNEGSKRVNSWPLQVAAFIAKNNIIRDFIADATGKTVAAVLKG